MPNFRIPIVLKEHIIHNANTWSQRTVEYALADFPLDAERIQAIILEAELVETMAGLVARGVSVRKEQSVRVGFLAKDLPGLRRGIVLTIMVPSGLFVRRTTWQRSPCKYDGKEDSFVSALVDVLTQEEREELTKYLNRVLRQHRLAILARQMVSWALGKFPTTGEVMANWPALATLVTDNSYTEDSVRKFVTRFRNPPRKLENYRNLAGWRTGGGAWLGRSGELYDRRVQYAAAESVLLAGSILSSYEHPSDAIRVHVSDFETFPGDPPPIY